MVNKGLTDRLRPRTSPCDIWSGCCRFVTKSRTGKCVLAVLRVLSTGVVMRIFAAITAFAALLALGGCFHHNQVYTQDPQVLPPLKLG
jgi:hypothetical protein